MARNDAAGTLEDIAVVVDPLANDSPANGLTVVSITQPAHGATAIDPGGKTVTYTPNTGFSGLDSFTYTVQDANSAAATAVIAVVVRAKGKADAPQVAPIDDTATTTATFGANGGTADLVVPPGAYDGSQGPLGPTDIFYLAFTEVLTPTGNVETPPESGTDPLAYGGLRFTFEAFFNTTPLENYVFPQPVTFTFSYDPNRIHGLDPATLQLFYWDADANQWSQEGLTLVSRDLTNHTITYQVAHFTEFASFGSGQQVRLILLEIYKSYRFPGQ